MNSHQGNNHFGQSGHYAINFIYLLIISFIKWSIILCDIVGLQQQKHWNPSFFSWVFFSREYYSQLYCLLIFIRQSVNISNKSTSRITSSCLTVFWTNVDGTLHTSLTTTSSESIAILWLVPKTYDCRNCLNLEMELKYRTQSDVHLKPQMSRTKNDKRVL